ncbi:MAG: PAS domain-containing sensor histidine kinase, partial [Leptolyngbya sp. SIO3F4]|nr:PAS domain-containing sensor histidine kinase [Leptolyngbya sp. SIO3F4]
ELRYTTVNLSALAQEILHDFQTSEPDRQVNVIVAPELTISADTSLMQVVLMNLLQNAWKFTSHHPTARIEFGLLPVEASEYPDPVYFVKDDGAGFDMTYSHKLFGVFQRLHSAQEFSGTGIGLASARRAIHRHGGQIWAKAALEEGATFFFTIPSHQSLLISGPSGLA